LDSTDISHKVRNAPDWNHQAFADDLSLYTENTAASQIGAAVPRLEWTGDLDQEVICNGRFIRQGALERQNNSQCQSSQGEVPHSKEQRVDCGMRGGQSLRPRKAGPPGGRGCAHDPEKYHEGHV